MKLKFKHQQFQKDAAEDRAGDADRQYPSSTKASGWHHGKVELKPLNKDYDVIELVDSFEYKTIRMQSSIRKAH